MIEMLSSRSEEPKSYTLWSCQKVCKTLIFLLDTIYIRCGTKLYRQIVGIPMGTNCTLINSYFAVSERDCMMPLSADKDAEIIETS